MTLFRATKQGDGTRRRLLNTLLTGALFGWLATVLYPVIKFLRPPKAPGPAVSSINAGPAEELLPNSGRIIRFGREPVIVIHTESGNFRAFSAVCTHLSCTVQYREDLKHIWCACHNGHFDLRGRNIAGPPPRPLPPFNVEVVVREIIVSRTGA